MADSCCVCDSPTAKSYHFGAKSCKACAAFFRRAIALNVTYLCKSGHTCIIHHERRYMCKSCRFEKCFQRGMQRELVQSKGKLCERERMASVTPPTPTFDHPIPSEPSCSKDGFYVVNVYTKLEAALNDRRKVMYTNLKMKDILNNTMAEIPFPRESLRLFDYRTYRGHERPEFTMIFDYIRSFPQFCDLETHEQGILFRYTCVADALIGMAYFSSKVAYEEKLLVNVDCSYYPLIPKPLTGTEPDAWTHFSSKEDFEKYKTIVVPMIENWDQLVVPMYQLSPSFSEYALLKGLVCWHMCYYKFNDKSKMICDNQRNSILQALFALSDRDDEAAVLRLGELLLFISNIFVGFSFSKKRFQEKAYDLVTSLYMVTFFGIIDTDPFVVDLLDQSAI